MQISMRADYGLRAMIDLAQRAGQGPVLSAQIAARQQISEAYLDQLLTALRKAGLVRSIRGPSGGHTLAKAAEEITIAEIVGALEGTRSFVSCMIDEETCQLGKNCAILQIWRQMEEASLAVLRATTLAQLAARQSLRQDMEMYYI